MPLSKFSRYLLFCLMFAMVVLLSAGCMAPKTKTVSYDLKKARDCLIASKLDGKNEKPEFKSHYQKLQASYLEASSAFYACRSADAMNIAQKALAEAEALGCGPNPNDPPVAKFSVPTEANFNDKVLFDATASLDRNDDPLTYIWDFGDGKTDHKNSPRVVHKYAEPRTYKARLTVRDSRGGSDSILHAISIVGTILMDSEVLFDFDKAVLKQGAEKKLAPVLKQLQADARYHVRLAGYTDSTGPEDYNMRLSENRALAVKAFLVERGIAKHRISTSGMGQKNPIATNNTKEGRAKNRRTEITLMLKQALQ